MESVAVLGLGNPGSRYRATRHNLGFMVLEELAGRWASRFRAGKGPYDIAQTIVQPEGRQVYLVAPLTMMNGSGAAASDIIERYDVPLSAMLVVLDDFWLPLGNLRFRRQGSDGGHNGLASIIESVQSDAFPRLRLGIGKVAMPPKSEMADFVLSPFDEEEKPAILDMIHRAADAVEDFARTGSASPKNPRDTESDGDTA